MPKINLDAVEEDVGARYPSPFDEPCRQRRWKRLGDAGGLTKVGVSLCTLPPGAWASQRHWHTAEDEFVYIVSGECVLIDDDGETPLKAGDSCAHPANDGNGHHLVNRSEEDTVFLVCSNRDRDNDDCHYPDADFVAMANGTPRRKLMRKDGSAY